MVLEAYIDDSYESRKVFVLAGYIAPREEWQSFSEEWSELLRHGVFRNDGIYYFKMSEMASLAERMERVSWFYRVIENHNLIAISCAVRRADVERAKSRIFAENASIEWGFVDDEYTFTIRCLLDMFHNHRGKLDQFIPSGTKVNFIFDEQSEKRKILSAWEEYISRREEEVRRLYGERPRFEDDTEFLPLQAADFWAWWIRRWYVKSVDPEERIQSLDFGIWQAKRKDLPRIHISFNEDQIVQDLSKWFVQSWVQRKL